MKYVFMTTLYNEQFQDRCDELIYCLSKNLDDKRFHYHTIIYDTRFDDHPNKSMLRFVNGIMANKIHMDGRPTYGDFFSVANSNHPGKHILLCNADIYYDETLSNIEPRHVEDRFIMISRYEKDKNGNTFFPFSSGPCGSADTWIFKSPIREFKSDFKLGVQHCDSRIAWEADKAGIEVVNPCKSVMSFHMHANRRENKERETPYEIDLCLSPMAVELK